MQQDELQDIIFAIIIASKEPVPYAKLKTVFPNEVTENQIKTGLTQLLKNKHTILRLVKIAEGYSFQVKEKFAPWVLLSKGEQEKTNKLSKTALETLAIIAYKQPITRKEIEEIRNNSLHITALQQLEEKGWIKQVGNSKRAILYGTTKEFLLYFGLNSVHELPELPELMERR